jgi:hypothetical protein
MTNWPLVEILAVIMVKTRQLGRWLLACSIRKWDSTGMRAYEEVAEFIARRGPREVADFRPSPEVHQHVVELLRSEKTTGLTAEERRELDHYENLELLMNLAKARARQLLAHER